MGKPGGQAWAAAALCAVMLGCATPNVAMLYKPGSLAPQRQADIDACTIASFKEIPQVIATTTTGGYSIPGEIECREENGRTVCREEGRRNVPVRTRNYDVNDQLRDRFVRRCLTERGYSYIQRPVCATPEERNKVLREPHPATPEELICSAGP